MNKKIIIIGAGPAGLTAAWEAEKNGIKTIILESDNEVGGISRTVNIDGWRFDIGGHRFFTKVNEVNDIWNEILNEQDFLIRPRLSRIYYNKKFFYYPLKPLNALKNLGILEALLCIFSYFKVQIFPPKSQDSFEDWVVARFGWRLYNIFFKTYTEKVWGIKANEIGSDWASQRIKNLSLMKAIFNSIKLNTSQEIITTLIDEFKYPKYGPGMMWEKAAEKLKNKGHQIYLNSKVIEIKKIKKSYNVITEDGKEFVATHVISSLPLANLPNIISEIKEPKIIEAGKNLKFRDFLTVAFVVDIQNTFPDNWIYIHDPDVEVGRIQNYGNWSPFLVKDNKTCLGLEYFVNQGDELWEMDNNDLINFAKNELSSLGLIDTKSIIQGYVFRMPKAYPVYDLEYSENVETISKWISSNHPHIYPVGRNGMHRYNNQDHSMVTAYLSIRNILGEQNDIWNVNVEDEYHEEKRSERLVPKKLI